MYLTLISLLFLFLINNHQSCVTSNPCNIISSLRINKSKFVRRDNIQRHLAAIVPKKDQILLIGPPYKVLKDHHLRSHDILSSLRLGDCEDDPTFVIPSTDESCNVTNNNNENNENKDHDTSNQESMTQSVQLPSKRKSILHTTTEQSGSRRIFLFSKQALSENAPDPNPCILSPQLIAIPTEPDPSPIFNNNNNDNSPLHQALTIYERRFMLHLCQGRAYADAADLRLTSCRNCIQEQAVMVRALRAAVSNLSDHWNNATRTRMDFTTVYVQKMEEHGKLLSNFEILLKNLSKIELDKELKAIARVNGRVMETLLDTVPVEHMRKWATQCQTGYANLQSLFGQLETSFDELKQLYHRKEDGENDLKAEQLLIELEKEVEGNMVSLRDKQASRLMKLTEDHKGVVKVVLEAMDDEGCAQASFTTLEAMSKASGDIVPSMKADDVLLVEAMMKVADAKTEAMKRMKVRLRQISVAQNRLHKVIIFAGPQGTLRDTLNHHCDDMTHLEHLVKLPESYRIFLSEIRRRRAYGKAVESCAASIIERLSAMRNVEISARNKFLQGPGQHIMPCFYEMFVPTLASTPPQYAPQMPSTAEMDTLPIFVVEEDSGVVQGSANESSDAKMAGDSNVGGDSSSLTEVSSEPQDDQKGSASGSLSRLSINNEKTNQEKSEPLLVRAEAPNGNDVIMDAGSNVEDDGNAAADAERKALAYENDFLRQAIRSYVDKDRLKDMEADQDLNEKIYNLQNELEKMRSELKKTKSKLEQTSTALSTYKSTSDGKPNDKISHSSFQVGDVALFMPIWSGSEGKRAYVAFHSDCPHRFLSTDSIVGKPDYVLGRIVYQEELVAGAVGTDTNPYNLNVGAKFWILTVEVLKLGRRKGN